MAENGIMTKSRLLSLDVFRGLTIAGMVLVNSPGNETAYTQLDHSAWDGCTFTDLVFPFFVFIVGVSLVFSLSKRLEQGVSADKLLSKVFKRTAIIFGLGLFLNGFPYYHLSTIRILGVLQHIALCYYFGSLLFLKTRVRTQALIAVGLLVGYWLAMTRIPVPGYGIGNLTKEGNLAAYIDRMLLAGHMYRPVYDPEGILSTLPAIATGLLGNLTGVWLLSQKHTPAQKVQAMIAASLVFVNAGLLWGRSFPINKALWTSSYVLWTGGLALLLLALCYWLIEIKNWRTWSKPFEIFGLNAIAVYLLHILFLKIQNLIHLPRPDGSSGNLRFFITQHLFGWASLQNASLFYALGYTLLWLVVLWTLYRRKIFIKI
jgi:predicted acyltransferase